MCGLVASSSHERRNEVDAEVAEELQQLLPHGKIKDCRSDGCPYVTAGALQHRDFVTTLLEQQRWRTMLPTRLVGVRHHYCHQPATTCRTYHETDEQFL